MQSINLRALTPSDSSWVREFWIKHWGSDFMVVRSEIIHPGGLPGFVIEQDGRVTGLVTFRIDNHGCELLSLDSLIEGQGIGTALLEATIAAARRAGCRRFFLVTTNDNLKALRFYQRRGLHLSALRPGAVDESRKIKPSIPLTGEDCIPIRDELELEMDLCGRGFLG